MKFSIFYCLILPVLVLDSCKPGKSRYDVDVSRIRIEEIRINRYDRALFSVNRDQLMNELEKLQPSFPMFLAGELNDSSNLHQILNYLEDTLIQRTFADTEKKFGNIRHIENELTNAFAHLLFYYPSDIIPHIYTYISGFDYENSIIFEDNFMLIAIDMYLGTDYPRYRNLGLPEYILPEFNPGYLVSDCMLKLAEAKIDNRKTGKNLLDLMISGGKKILFCKAMSPKMPDSVLLHYSTEHMDWITEHEAEVWAFVIENKMLYSQDVQYIKKLIGKSPFTAYFGSGSPPRLGIYLGWRIVSIFMENNPEVTLSEIMNNYDAQQILNNSGYKPGI
jgi:hypothetical protein